jgi:Mrp family chromosome partitioning ATPase
MSAESTHAEGQRGYANTSVNSFAGDPSLLRVRNFVESSESPPPDPLKWLLRTFRGRYKQVARYAALSAFVAILVVTIMSSPRYESEALIRIAATQPFILYENDSMQSRDFDAFVLSQISLLSGPVLLDRTVQNIVDKHPTIALSKQELQSRLNISQSKSLITLKTWQSDPAIAAIFTNTLLDTYLSMQREGTRSRVSYREQELSQREQRLLDKIKNKNAQALEIGGEYGVDSAVAAHSTTVEQLQTASKKLADYNRMITELQETGITSASLSYDKDTTRALVDDDALDEMIYDRMKLRTELIHMEDRYQPWQRNVVNSKSALAILEQSITDRRESIRALKAGADPLSSSESRSQRLQELAGKRDGAKEIYTGLRDEARILNRKIIELKFLEKESIVLRELLDETRRILDEIQLESRFDVPGVIEVVSRGQIATEPAKDTRNIFSVIAAVFMVGLTLLIYVGAAIIRPAVRFSDDLGSLALQAPLIGCLEPLGVDGESLPSADISAHKIRNAIQLTNLEPLQAERRARIMSVVADSTDVECGEIASRLGRSFSDSGLKTLLVNADIGLASVSNSDDSHGWRELLKGDSHTVKELQPGFDYLNAGDPFCHRDENVSLNGVRAAISSLASEYDVIIFNIGVFGSTLSASLINTETDLSVLVTKPGSALASVRRAAYELNRSSQSRTRLVLSGIFPNDPFISP